MKTATSIDSFIELRSKLEGPVGFVPTMGSLHEGHLSLIRQAKNDCASVVVSIFVNPTQFGPGEDYESYPRSLDHDLELLRKTDVDLVFCPNAAEMYPSGYGTWVSVEGFSDMLEAASRPGHFKGVATVVLKLLNILRPDIAYFGQKDAQQAIIISKMVSDLNVGTSIRVMPIVREPNGLALSSRNVYLSTAEKRAATVLYRALGEASRLVSRGEHRAQTIKGIITGIIGKEPLAAIDYIGVSDLDTLEEIDEIDRPCLISLAVNIGSTRLIDNIIIDRNPFTPPG